ncbi:O-antigen ligase [Paenibacillus turicensis]|uniref:O-antigen ligase n=2 Tax=Paenibacillus turicensis TaxID=160487 RepID=A0ABS4FUW9_9BACL|nr:O-antigen ligase [Paenibacillus turicensis]
MALNWKSILYVLVPMTMLVAYMEQGWFYIDRPIPLFMMCIWMFLALFWCLRQNLEGSEVEFKLNHLHKKEPVSNVYPVESILWFIPLIVTSIGCLQLFFSPIHMNAHIELIVQFAFYTAFCFVIVNLLRDSSGLRVVYLSWLILGAVAIISALVVVYGLWSIPHALWQNANDPRMATRLGGVLQYPNTFGALMVAIILEKLMLLSINDDRRPIQLILCLWGCVCLFLTGSRGAFSVFLIGWGIGFLLLKGEALLRYGLYTFSLGIGAILVAKPLIQVNLLPVTQAGIANLMITTLCVLLWCYGGEVGIGKLIYYRSKVQKVKKVQRFEILGKVLILLAGVIAILTVVLDRYPSLMNKDTGLARILMYKDALQLWKKSPWFGYGGGAWRSMVYHVQSSAYVGKEVHSGDVDLLLNIGVIGLFVVLLGLSLLIYSMWKRRSYLLPACSAIILHSIIDFDLRYTIVWLGLFLLIGLHLVERSTTNKENIENMDLCVKKGWNKRLLPSFRGIPAGIGSPLSGSLLSIVLLVSLGFAIPFYISTSLTTQSVQSALRLAPYRSELTIALAKKLPLSQAEQLLLRGIHYDRQNGELWLLLGQTQAARQQPKATQALIQSARLNPYSAHAQVEALAQIALLSASLEHSGKQQAAAEVAKEGYRLYLDYRRLVQHSLQQPAFKNDRRFGMVQEAQMWGRHLATHLTSAHITSHLATKDLTKGEYELTFLHVP